ncbi:MAG TPA: biosynthetic peptidoglycan transglycosylase [Longimicrobium sp.]|jgi:membrane peptidoglycan carboxypeptidase|uniref:biosynthetic peptidoglycan transglycosylase n=1 Tax=Longimicrobium sp. TaxID=2029185 RepID=UPI002ED79D35
MTVAAAAALLAGSTGAVLGSLPDVRPLRRTAPGTTAFMRAAGEQATEPWVPLATVSPYLACAVVKAEDRRFFVHRGIHWRQLGKAVGRTARGARMGGSTITQQLARNLYLGPERTVRRKAREALVARRLERSLGKPRILELYLNVIEWGDGVWGAEGAARGWFGKPAAELDAFESVFLSGLVAAPRAPLAGANAQRAAGVQLRVADQLYRSGILTPDEWRGLRGRLADMHAALRAGTPAPVALRTPPGPPRPRVLPLPRRDAAAHLPAARAVADGCGLRNELQSERLSQENGR